MSNKFKKFEVSRSPYARSCNHGSGFPRHVMDSFPGTYCSMRRTRFSKSSSGGWHYSPKNYGAVSRRYIIGLLHKFVGKPYALCQYAFDQQVKKICGKTWKLDFGHLDDYIKQQRPRYSYIDLFFVDEEGILRSFPPKRRKPWKGKFTQRQISWNRKVRIPHFGQCRDFDRFSVYKAYETDRSRLSDDCFEYTPKAIQPILLGEFYVDMSGTILKLPVWTCKSLLMRVYHKYREYSYNGNIPFEEARIYIGCGIADRKKKLLIRKTWKAISLEQVKGLSSGQSYLVKRVPIEQKSYLEEIKRLKEKIPYITGALLDEYQKRLDIMEHKYKHLPQEVFYNLGYGDYCLFVKHSDVEKQLTTIGSKSPDDLR